MAEFADTSKINFERLQDSKLEFPQSAKETSIHHYTSTYGLEGILRNKILRFTNIKYMNDRDEIIAGFESMSKSWEIPEEDQKRFLSMLKNLSSQAFVCCFSLEGDSLSMWNYYTKEVNNQGYNIEFDTKGLVESILRNNPLLDGCEFAFGNVDYSKDNDSEYSQAILKNIVSSLKVSITKPFLTMAKEKRIGRLADIDDETLSKWEAEIKDIEKQQELYDLPIYFYNGPKCSFDKDSTGNYLYFIKRDCFKHEREFRIVITVPNELLPKLKDQGVYKFRVSNGVLIPYIELKFAKDVVKSITISPTFQSDLVELSIQDFMRYCEYKIQDYTTFIKHSNVPVRF